MLDHRLRRWPNIKPPAGVSTFLGLSGASVCSSHFPGMFDYSVPGDLINA